jgi:outer membrane lipoprotein-sorting protein
MRRLFPLALAVAVAALASPLLAQTADEVIAKNLTARGGLEKLKSVQALRMTGRLAMGPGVEAPMVLELKRGNRMRMEFSFQGMTGVQAFDGTSGWALMPFGGNKDVQPMPAEMAAEAYEQADIDGPLVDYKAKGHTVELVGKETVDGVEAYKLSVKMKAGSVRTIWIDTARNLEIRGEGSGRAGGPPSETVLGDYRDESGIMFPHTVEGGPKGAPQRQKIVIEKVELNPTLDDARFKVPAAAPPAEKPKS